jgi:hypothetical protein
MSQLDHELNKDRWNELKNDFKKAYKEESLRNSKFSRVVRYNVNDFLIRSEADV